MISLRVCQEQTKGSYLLTFQKKNVKYLLLGYIWIWHTTRIKKSKHKLDIIIKAGSYSSGYRIFCTVYFRGVMI